MINKTRIFIRTCLLTVLGGFLFINSTLAHEGEALKLAWTSDIGTPINIAPLVAGDRVLTVATDGPLVAFEAATGKIKWTFDPKEGVWDRGFSSHGEQVFVCLKGGKLTALNRTDGARQWTIDLGINCQRPAHFSGAAIYVSTTFVGPDLPADPLTGAKLFSINTANGHINWAYTTDDFLLQTATSYGDTVYLAGSYKDPNFTADEGGPAHYYALDAKSGQVKWTYISKDGTPKALYATKKRLVFVPYQDFVHGLDAATGKLLWRRDTGNWVPSLIGDGDVVYFGSANTFVHAWSTKDGRPLWRHNIPGGAFDYLLIKPALDGDRLYFMSQRGFVYALDRKKGTQIWSFSTGMNSRVGLSHGRGFLYMGDKNGRISAYKILK